MPDEPADVTMLLRAAATGRRSDLDALMEAIYGDLRRLAAAHMKGERPDHTLSPTALVHEAYVRLMDQRSVHWDDRLQFFGAAAQIIRRILIDHARQRGAIKRGGGAERVSLTREGEEAGASLGFDLVALDDALRELAELDARQARVVELRFFAGCTLEEAAEILGVTRRTVDRDWQAARAWLYLRLTDPRDGREDDHAG